MNNNGEMNSYSAGALKTDDALMGIVVGLSKAETILNTLISRYGFEESEPTERELADIAYGFKNIYFMLSVIGDYIIESKRIADEVI